MHLIDLIVIKCVGWIESKKDKILANVNQSEANYFKLHDYVLSIELK